MLSWQILWCEPLLLFFYWHETLKAKKRKPLVKTIGILTFMSSAFDRHFWLEDIFDCSMSLMIGWINIFGDVIGQKKMTSLTAVKCWASMKVRFSTILTRGFLFSQLGTSIIASCCKFPNKKLGPGYMQPCTGKKYTIFFCKMFNVLCSLTCHTICRARHIRGNSIDRVWRLTPALWHF